MALNTIWKGTEFPVNFYHLDWFIVYFLTGISSHWKTIGALFLPLSLVPLYIYPQATALI